MNEQQVYLVDTLDDLFVLFGGPTNLARVIGKSASTGTEAKRLQSIHVRHWPALLAEAAVRANEAEIADKQAEADVWRSVTSDKLVELHLVADRQKREAKERAAEERV